MKILVFDFETTDLNGYAVEFAGILFRMSEKKAKVLDVFACGINPLSAVSSYVAENFFIEEKKLHNQSTFKNLWGRISSLFSNADLIVAHNISFDYKILSKELIRMKIRVQDNLSLRFYKYNSFCTCKDTSAIYYSYPKLEEFVKDMQVKEEKLKTFYEKCLDKTKYNPLSIRRGNLLYHNAMFDTTALALAVVKLFRKFPNIRKKMEERTNNPSIFQILSGEVK